MSPQEFKKAVAEGIPSGLPEPGTLDPGLNHAPRRKAILSPVEKKLALRNALRYVPAEHHRQLAREFAAELERYGRIYMYRYKPAYPISARKLEDYPFRSVQAGAIMLMLSNNLDRAVAQHPDELITYGGNGAVFQNWAQYRLCMNYLAEMTDEQTLVLYSGHPMGLFPSHADAPRVVVTNGMVIPNYSSGDDYNRLAALGVTSYGQMTAGSFMYIGPQGIVHGTTISILGAGRLYLDDDSDNPLAGKLYVSSGLGGMSGAQGKAAVIAGCVGVIAEINPSSANTGNQFEAKVMINKQADQTTNLYSGMYATVFYEKGTQPQILVPQSALVTKGQLVGLYAVGQTGQALLRWVKTGTSVGDSIEILSGLADGETYIQSSNGKLFDGALVVTQ